MNNSPISILKSVINKHTKANELKAARERALGWAMPNIQPLDLLPLTKEELRQIEEVWGKLGMKPYSLFYQLFKTIDHFDPSYLSDDLYYPKIVRALNPRQYCTAFSHKGHLPVLFGDIKQPSLICLCNRGVYYNANFDIISEGTVLQLLFNSENFIIKPTKNTSGGKGVKLVNGGNKEEIKTLIDDYGDNWIVQEPLEQSEVTAKFNPSSLNTIRVTTLFINGKVSTQSIIFKTGSVGSVVDNLSSGGVLVGVSSDGELREYGINKKYCKCEKTASGVVLKGNKINEVPAMAELMEFYHRRYFPSMGIVGWDVALDANNQPIVIVANLVFPGILFEQLAISKPIFGDRTEEVIQFVLNKR